MTRPAYAALLGRLLPVYEALERAAERWRADPRVGPLVQPELHRAQRLRDDLEHLGAAADAAAPAEYAQRVEQVTTAPAFVAHHYTRYLGDLSGGQVLRVAVERSLGLRDGSGTSYLHFPGLRPATSIRAYRRRLDDLLLTQVEREELVAEALVSYRLSIELTAAPELA